MNFALGIIIALLIVQILQNNARLKDVTQELRKIRDGLEGKDFFKNKDQGPR